MVHVLKAVAFQLASLALTTAVVTASYTYVSERVKQHCNPARA